MTTKTAERTDFLGGVLISAVEGGIGYWAQVRSYSYKQERGRITDVRAKLRDIELERPADWTDIDLDTIERGLEHIKSNSVDVLFVRRIRAAEKENDASDIDSDDADVILQTALFGEVIYG